MEGYSEQQEGVPRHGAGHGSGSCFVLATSLAAKLEKFLDRKLAKNRPVKSEDTNIIISVNERGQDDLIKRFDDTNVNWSVIERQLVVWSELFRRGKKLTVKISFNYVESSQGSATSSRKADKRGSSITDRMLTERDTQLDVEEASSGRPSIWSNVYELMRCQVLSCNLGPHCWRDPVGKKHYKLRTSQLRRLIEHVKEGYTLQTHDDVPEEIRQQLYAEDNQKRQKPASTSAVNCPPINITNVLPTPAPQTAPASDMSSATPINRLDIPRPRDAAVKDYCAWQQSQVEDPEQKAAYQKACKVIMDDCMDLELIHQDPNPEFLIEKGVKRGAALHIVRDIERWVKRHKRAETIE